MHLSTFVLIHNLHTIGLFIHIFVPEDSKYSNVLQRPIQYSIGITQNSVKCLHHNKHTPVYTSCVCVCVCMCVCVSIAVLDHAAELIQQIFIALDRLPSLKGISSRGELQFLAAVFVY